MFDKKEFNHFVSSSSSG